MSTDNNTGESLTVSIVEAVSSTEGRSMTELPPLNDVVDPEALAALFPPSTGDGRDSDCVSFEYSDSVVTVYGGDRVVVKDETEVPAP